MLFSNVCSNANLQKCTGEGQVRGQRGGASAEVGTFVDGHQPAVMKPVADSLLQTEGLQPRRLASSPGNTSGFGLVLRQDQHLHLSVRRCAGLTVKRSSIWALKVLKAVVMPIVRSDFGSTPETKTGNPASSV